MNKINYIAIALALVLLLPGLSFSIDPAVENAQKELPVEIDADSISFDSEGGVYVAEGNVVAKQTGITLMADRIVIDMNKGLLVARGNLKGTDEGGNQLSGDLIELDLNMESALLLNGKLFFKKNNVYISSEELRKVGPQSYEADRTTYTACNCDEGEKPAWSITTKSSTVTIGEYFTGWHTFFRVKEVPVFYLPYVRVPVKMERQSGFLLPTPGYSDVRGASLKNYLYWVISRSSDATLTLDADVKRGIGGGLELRYYRSPKSYSELNFNYYREYDIDRVRTFRENVQNLSRPLSAGENRWAFKFSHDETLPYDLQLRTDIHLVSDDEYFIDFEENQDKRAVASLESSVSVTKNWKLYSLVTEFRRFDNLLDEKDEAVLQKIPEITFTALPRKFYSTPLYISMQSSAVNYIRRSGIDGQRIDLAPRVSLPLRPGSYLELTPSITPRYTSYRVVDALGTRYPDRLIYEFKTDMVTTLVRDFKTPIGGEGPKRHTIRPRLSYRFVPDVDQTSLPDYDDIDLIGEANELEYSVNSTLSYIYKEKEKLKRHEYLYLNLSQVYDIIESQRGLSGPGDERRPFADIKAELRLSPAKLIRFSADGDYDVYERWFDRYYITANLADKRGDKFYASYRFDRSLATRYMEGSARLRVNKALDLIFKKRYSFDEERSLETMAAAEFRQQCWGAVLTYRRTPEENLFLLNISLESLGDLIELSDVR
jgi:LPS-assembly protein